MKCFCFVCENDYNDDRGYISCKCGEEWCSEKCAEKDGYNDEFSGECNHCKGK